MCIPTTFQDTACKTTRGVITPRKAGSDNTHLEVELVYD